MLLFAFSLSLYDAVIARKYITNHSGQSVFECIQCSEAHGGKILVPGSKCFLHYFVSKTKCLIFLCIASTLLIPVTQN